LDRRPARDKRARAEHSKRHRSGRQMLHAEMFAAEPGN
jgi:hypothetical protein